MSTTKITRTQLTAFDAIRAAVRHQFPNDDLFHVTLKDQLVWTDKAYQINHEHRPQGHLACGTLIWNQDFKAHVSRSGPSGCSILFQLKSWRGTKLVICRTSIDYHTGEIQNISAREIETNIIL